MEMTPHEQSYYMQQQQQQQQLQQQQQSQPPPLSMFNTGQPQQQSFSHMNQQMQRSPYQYPQMRMYGGGGMGYPRSHFDNMPGNRNMLPPNLPEQNVSTNNNMYSMNPSLRRANNQSHMYMSNSAPQNRQLNGMGPWEQALNEPYSPYNHYPSSPSPQHMPGPHNQNMQLAHNQTMSVPRNQNSQMQHNPSSQIPAMSHNQQSPMSHNPTAPMSHNPAAAMSHNPTAPMSHNPTAPMSHNPTAQMPHNQNTSMSMHNQFSGLENPMSNYQTTVSPSITRPHTVSVNSTFGNAPNIQNVTQPPHIQGSNIGPGSRHPPQYPEGLMKRLVESSGAESYKNCNDEINQGILMPDLKGCNTSNDRNLSNYNLNKLDSIKDDEQKISSKSRKGINEQSLNIKSEDDNNNGDETDTIPPGLLDSEESFELITKSLMEKPFNPFRDSYSESPLSEDILPSIPSICKSPLAQKVDKDDNSTTTKTVQEIQNLDAMSLSNLAKSSLSDEGGWNQSSAVTNTTSNGSPSVMQSLYKQLASDKEGEQRNGASSSKNNVDSNNNENPQQSCDKVVNLSSCNLSGSMPTFNFEYYDDLDVFLPNYGNKPSERPMSFREQLLCNSNQNGGEDTSEQPASLSSLAPDNAADLNNKGEGSFSKGRNKSDSEFSKPTSKRNKGTAKKGARKSPYDSGNKNTKKVVSSSKSKSFTEDTTTSSTSTTTYISSPEPEKPGKLYYENKVNYRYHQYLRKLTSDPERNLNEPYPFKKLQNCEKVFLKQLSTPVMDSWIHNSLTPGVENDKDIDLKNMTKRKITIYEDIPSESIYECFDRSTTEPFRYFCPDNDTTQEPSKKLVDILLKK